MKRYGSELDFIARIGREGNCLKKDIEQSDARDRDIFEINKLSITHGTYIASAFNSYVVRLKNPPPARK